MGPRARGPRPWRIAADTGGTFTDVVAIDPRGHRLRAKLLSSGALRGRVAAREGRTLVLEAPLVFGAGEGLLGLRLATPGVSRRQDERAPRVVAQAEGGARLSFERVPDSRFAPGARVELRSPEAAPVLGARLLTATPLGSPLPPLELRVGTTLATNALLTGQGARVLFVTSEGFADLPRIAHQARDDLFALAPRARRVVEHEALELRGRLTRQGEELVPLDLAPLDAALAAAGGDRSLAVALLHADADPRHEQQVAAWARRRGVETLALSHELAPTIRLLVRASTVLVEAHLAPVVERYLASIRQALEGRRCLVTTSAGGLVADRAVRAKDMLLSGPAGGVVGAAAAARRAGLDKLIAFDMGGTSADVARVAGAFDYVFEHGVGGVRLASPALAIESVAAGGGSICSAGPEGLSVGPASAGADPGPACYGAGGPLTLTDVNLLLGRLEPSAFGLPLEPEAAERAFDAVRAAAEAAGGEKLERETLLEAFIDLADERMADAIREVTLRRGHDPAEHALVAFGGAGGQHALALAERLDIDTVLVPADAGLLSAAGIEAARRENIAEAQLLEALEKLSPAELARRLADLGDQALGALVAEGVEPERCTIARRLGALRFAGQDDALDLELDEEARPLGEGGARGRPPSLAEAFRARYRRTYGHLPGGRAVEVVALRVLAAEEREESPRAGGPPEGREREVLAKREVLLEGARRTLALHRLGALPEGEELVGPALVIDPHGATLVRPGWRARALDGGGLLCCRGEGARSPGAGRASAALLRSRPESLRLDLFTERLFAIAREMGEALRRTAVSTNVKERLDFSCALLDAEGALLANAPHVPVHLGALGPCVRALTRALPLAPGDVAVTNHPAFGGSHLPDVTLIEPVYDDAQQLVGYVAARAHHAELGGVRPGSMPADATRLIEEGVVIPPTRLVERGAPRFEALRRLLLEAPYPSRAVEDNLADLGAALAACHRGAALFGELARAEGTLGLARFARRLAERSARAASEALAGLGEGERERLEQLDDGTPLALRVAIRAGRARFDFAGSGPVHPGNLNATPAIVRSVVLYVMRLLVARTLPLNEGLLAPLELAIPEGLLAPHFPEDPAEAPAVVGGNVELSQRLANLLVTTLGLAAASAGTMNNLLFGDASRSYYETIGGGAGGAPGAPGASALQTHMTNTRITDPELVEHRFGVRVERFAIRRGSGGRGRFPGGEGLVRALRFVAPASLSLLTQHRREGPAGLAGGGPGAPGRQRLHRASGAIEELGSLVSVEVEPGDLLVVETPGGGGYEAP